MAWRSAGVVCARPAAALDGRALRAVPHAGRPARARDDSRAARARVSRGPRGRPHSREIGLSGGTDTATRGQHPAVKGPYIAHALHVTRGLRVPATEPLE